MKEVTSEVLILTVFLILLSSYGCSGGGGSHGGVGGTTTPTGWQISTITTTVGSGLDMTLDSSNRPQVVYTDSANDLIFASWNGAAWQTTTIDSPAGMGWVDCAICKDSSNNFHVSYFDPTNKDLKYAYYNGISWQVSTVDSNGEVGYFPSICADSSGKPHIVYKDGTNSELKYAFWDGSNWQFRVIDTLLSYNIPSAITCCQLELINNNPVAIYGKNCAAGPLNMAIWNGQGWDISTIVTGGYLPLFNLDMVKDSNNNLHICFQTQADFIYGYWDGTSWQLSTIEEYAGFGCAIALDTSNKPHVVYLGESDELKYAYWDGTDWQISEILSYTDMDWQASMAIDSNNHPHILFWDGPPGPLKYAVR